MTSQLRFIISQVVSDTKDKNIFTFRATKYLKDECEDYFRISVAKMDLSTNKSSEEIELAEDIHTADECKKIFERFQTVYLGYIKQPLKMQEFL